MKKSICVCLLGLTVSLFSAPAQSAQNIEAAQESPTYSNELYGFSLSLPPGKYKAKHNKDGEGFSVKDGKGFTLLAYGTKSFAVFEKSFAQVVQDMHKEFDTVTEVITFPESNTFHISGLKNNNLIHIKCILYPEYAKVLRITHGKSAHEHYTNLCTTAMKTFK